MTDIIKKFNYGARWNTFESVFYKAILATHQTCLFYFAPKQVFGFSSLLFAIIYLAVELINLGLDYSIAQLSVNYFQNRFNFKTYFIPQVILQTAILATLLGLIIGNCDFLNIVLLPQAAFLNFNQWLLLAIIIVCESLRKTLRLIAQILFLNKPMAILESSLIMVYVSTFWLSILFGCQINIYTIYIPLLIQSLIGMIGLLYLIIPQLSLMLKKLPQAQISLPTTSWSQIFYARIQNYLYQLSELLFTSNFLIYLFSSFTSLATLGSIKLANYLAVFIKTLLERAFGLTLLASFAQSKALITEQKIVFNLARKRLSLTLISLFLTFGIYTSLKTCLVGHTNYLALLFFGFTLINNFFIIYEKLFLIYNKLFILFLLNITSIILFILFIYLLPQIGIAGLIILLTVLRAASLLIVKITTSRFF